MSTLVLDIGNTLLSDEGIGVHVIHALEVRFGEMDDVILLGGGTLSFTLAGAIEDADQLIVVDASELKAAPGTVRTFIAADMDAFLNTPRRSVHEVGLMDLMTIARLVDRLPARRALVGIQPDVVDWGEVPTAAVAAAIPNACGTVIHLIEAWSLGAGTDQIADGLVFRVGNIDGQQLTGAMQPGQVDGVTTVGLNPTA